MIRSQGRCAPRRRREESIRPDTFLFDACDARFERFTFRQKTREREKEGGRQTMNAGDEKSNLLDRGLD